MTVAEKRKWKEWAEELRQQMMRSLTPEITKSVVEIRSEINSTKTEDTIKSAKFWNACQSGKGPNDHLAKAGFDIEFDCDEAKKVHVVTLRLNDKWMPILNSVIERNNLRDKSTPADEG